MMEYQKVNYENMYGGSISPLDTNYAASIGYQNSSSNLGVVANPTVANQLNEVISKIKEGVKNVEMGTLQSDLFESIPRQQFNEIRAITKLTGVRPSMHAPLIDPAGFGEKGWGGESARIDSERRLLDVIEKSQLLDDQGNIPVVIHSSSASPGAIFAPNKELKPGQEGRFEVMKNIAVNRESGQFAPLEREKNFHPMSPEDFDKGGTEFTPEQKLHSINEAEWDNKMTDLANFSKHANETIGNSWGYLVDDYANVYATQSPEGTKFKKLKNEKGDFEEVSKPEGKKAEAYNQLRQADIFLDNVRLGFNGAFEKAYKYGSPEQKKQLEKLSKEYKKEMAPLQGGLSEKGEKIVPVFAPVQKKEILSKSIQRLHEITSEKAPQVFSNIKDFAVEKSSKTFGNVAYESYKRFGEKAPIIAIENLDPERGTFSTAKEMKELIGASRKEFINNLVGNEKMNKKKAAKIADKLIGATWDVGHLNMHKKFGFKDEDFERETKKIAKDVKHVHLTDNFGFSDTHLTPGMGNVPFKKHLEALEKAGKLKDVRQIVEAGGLINHFKRSPTPYILSAMQSPIYGAKMDAYWNPQVSEPGSYFGFPMSYLPEKHFSMYGTGFSMLPEELGGQVPGTQSRFSGTGMA